MMKEKMNFVEIIVSISENMSLLRNICEEFRKLIEYFSEKV